MERRRLRCAACAARPGRDGTKGETVVDHVRLFPLVPGVRWTYRVQDQILPSLKRAKVPVRWTDLVVRHTGYADPAAEARKLERNIKILKRDLEERPNDPFVLFSLELQRFVESAVATPRLEFLGRSLAGSAPADSIVRKLYALIARVHQMTGNSQKALARTSRGGVEARCRGRRAVVPQGRHASAPRRVGRGRAVLTVDRDSKRPDQFCSFDQGIYGHLTRRNLVALATERGHHAEAERLWAEVLAECPGDREAVAKLKRLKTVPVGRQGGQIL